MKHNELPQVPGMMVVELRVGMPGGAEIRDRHMLSLAEYSTARFDALMHEIEDMAAPLCRVVRERMDKEAADPTEG